MLIITYNSKRYNNTNKCIDEHCNSNDNNTIILRFVY